MRHLIKNQRGQVAVEYILITAIAVAVLTFVAAQIRQQEVLAGFISKPWAKFAGMIENGVWEESKKSKAKHPNHLNRHISLQAEDL